LDVKLDQSIAAKDQEAFDRCKKNTKRLYKSRFGYYSLLVGGEAFG
jgi:hypothetical protein